MCPVHEIVSFIHSKFVSGFLNPYPPPSSIHPPLPHVLMCLMHLCIIWCSWKSTLLFSLYVLLYFGTYILFLHFVFPLSSIYLLFSEVGLLNCLTVVKNFMVCIHHNLPTHCLKDGEDNGLHWPTISNNIGLSSLVCDSLYSFTFPFIDTGITKMYLSKLHFTIKHIIWWNTIKQWKRKKKLLLCSKA